MRFLVNLALAVRRMLLASSVLSVTVPGVTDGIPMFRQLWVFDSLLSNIFIDDFTARQYKN